MRGQVVVVEDSDAKHSGVDAGAEEKDGNEACQLQDKITILGCFRIDNATSKTRSYCVSKLLVLVYCRSL